VAQACLELAAAYAATDDEGTNLAAPPDPARAAELYRRACDLGSAPACVSLGAALEPGRGLPADAAAALPLYRQACDLGDDQACDDRSRLAPPPR
jgi:TPR repeat protein